ncbi:MAG TPA: hypothetical protein VJR02_15245 [Pyrinomonadaceae bacterium]|nr:hypothetical protein [Pyrinomonadaceae bacterium]
MFINLILILIPTGDYYLSLPQYSYVPVNVFVYAIGVYGIVALLPSVRESLSRKDASKCTSAATAKGKHPEPDGRA